MLKISLLTLPLLFCLLSFGQQTLSAVTDCKGECKGLRLLGVSGDSVYYQLDGANYALVGIDKQVSVEDPWSSVQKTEKGHVLSSNYPDRKIILDTTALLQYKADKEAGKKPKFNPEWMRSEQINHDGIPKLKYLEENYENMELIIPSRFFKKHEADVSHKIPYSYVLERFNETAKDFLFGFDKKQIKNEEPQRFIKSNFLYASDTPNGDVIIIFDTQYSFKYRRTYTNGSGQVYKTREFIGTKEGDFLMFKLNEKGELIWKSRLPKVYGAPLSTVVIDNASELTFVSYDFQPKKDHVKSHLWLYPYGEKKWKTVYEISMAKKDGALTFKELCDKPKKASYYQFASNQDEYVFLFVEKKVKIKKFIHQEVYEKFQFLRLKID